MVKSNSINDFYRAISSGDPRFNLLQTYFYQLDISLDNPFLDQALNQIFSVSLLVQSIDIPNFTIMTNNKNLGMSYPDRTIIIPDRNEVTITLLNTEFAPHEKLFLEWMKDVTSDTYTTSSKPFTRSTVRVSFLNQSLQKIIFSYVLVGAYPKHIESIHPNFAGMNDITRDIIFDFNWMYIDQSIVSLDIEPKAQIEKSPSSVELKSRNV